MADIVSVGIAGRVYVRFRDGIAADRIALGAFKRAGARYDRERDLWFVGEHNRLAALAACIETGGDSSGSAPLTMYAVVPDGGIPLESGWTLTAADDQHIWFINPFTPESNDRGACVVTWLQVEEAAMSRRLDTSRAAKELLATAGNLLATRERNKLLPCPRCKGKIWWVENRKGETVRGTCPLCG